MNGGAEPAHAIQDSRVDIGGHEGSWNTIHTLSEEFRQYASAPEGISSAFEQNFRTHFREFERAHGEILDFYFSASQPAACVRTPDHLFLTFVPLTDSPQWISELLYECHTLHVEVRQLLKRADRQICLELLFILTTQLLRLLEPSCSSTQVRARAPEAPVHSRAMQDGTAQPHRAPPRLEADSASAAAPGQCVQGPQLQQLYRQQFGRTRAFYERSAQRVAQTEYFAGMVIGGLTLLVLVAAFAAAAGAATPSAPNLAALQRDVPVLLTCLLVGGIGAIASVMQRMTAGGLRLKYQAGIRIVVLVGMFRPLIGAVFALVVYLMIVTVVVPIRIPPGVDWPLRPLYFYAVAAFFAGFSERWVQDMLAAGQGRMALGNGGDASPAR